MGGRPSFLWTPHPTTTNSRVLRIFPCSLQGAWYSWTAIAYKRAQWRPRNGGINMSKVCEICGKHPVAGRSISHSHRVTNRKFRPNIQRVTIVQNGQKRKMNVCTRCLKKGNLARTAY